MEEQINVNSELYFNEKLNIWLNNITKMDIVRVLQTCFMLPLHTNETDVHIYPINTGDPVYGRAIRFDQKINFGKDFCVIFELKVGTEATPGQLRNYLEYIRDSGYREGYVILLSRNTRAHTKPGYDLLVHEFPNLFFTTWGEFESRLKTLFKSGTLQSKKIHTENLLSLLVFLTDIEKRSERLILKPAPPSFHAGEYISNLVPAAPPKKKGAFLAWSDREHFWKVFVDHIVAHTDHRSLCAFRFDLYEYLIRWAFHIHNVYLDIYEDKNYEYYYKYFINHIFPHREDLPENMKGQLSEMYRRFLLIREEEVLRTGDYSIFFKRVGMEWYAYIVHDRDKDTVLPYIQLSRYIFS